MQVTPDVADAFAEKPSLGFSCLWRIATVKELRTAFSLFFTSVLASNLSIIDGGLHQMAN